MSRRERWVAPAEDGGILIDPPLSEVERMLETNRKRLDGAEVRLLKTPLCDVREQTRDLACGLAWTMTYGKYLGTPNLPARPSGPIIATGHQPDFFHPGVWIKNFAINGLARRLNAVPLNLVIETDVAKSTGLSFPKLGADPAQIRVVQEWYDHWDGVSPYVNRRIRDDECFRSFSRRAELVWKQWNFTPLLPVFWAGANEAIAESHRLSKNNRPTISICLSQARLLLERSWGCNNFELSITYPDRRLYLAHILSDLPRFRAVYNECVQAYRRRYGLRSRNHPVPDLASDGDFLEAPFWWFDLPRNQRSRLFVRPQEDHLELRSGLDGFAISIRKNDESAFQDLGKTGVGLYTRALTTTMFLRLCLADLFIHGIGGAKYDEVTDDIIRRYFGIEPPEYMVVSGTLHLPFPRFPATRDDHRRIARQMRDLQWHPEQFADASDPKVRELIEQKREWLAREPKTHAAKRERYRELLRLTEAIRPGTAKQEAELQQSLDRCDQELAANEILFRRDYPFILYPEEKLKPFCTQFLDLNV